MKLKGWSVKTKYTLACAILCIIPLILYAHSMLHITKKQLDFLEKENLSQQIHMARKHLDNTGRELLIINRDYSEWDEAYDRVNKKDLKWLDDNISGWLPRYAGADIVLLLDTNGKIIDNFNSLDNNNTTYLHNPLFEAAMQKHRGHRLMQTHLGPAIISYNPVLPTNLQGNPRGVLILGKLINQKMIKELNNFSSAKFVIYDSRGFLTYADSQSILRFQDGFGKIQDKILIEGSTEVGQLKDKSSFMMEPLRSSSGYIIGALGVISPQDKILNILESIFVHSAATLIISLSLALMLAFLLSCVFSERITRLSTKAAQAAQGDFSISIPNEGKDEIGQLAQSLQQLLQTIRNKIVDLKETNKELSQLKEIAEELSITDGLTQLYNYRYFISYLDMEIKRSRRYCHPLSLLMLDIDYFKNYNDCNGHPAGNVVLAQLAEILKNSCRETDVITRYGGEEFAIILSETDSHSAMLVAETIREKVGSSIFPLTENQPRGKITVSIGLATLPKDAEDLEELVTKADQALYWAKKTGKNKAVLYSSHIEL